MLGALALGVPTAKAAPWDLAQATPPPAAPQAPISGNAAAHPPHNFAGITEARITELRTKLRINAAEEPQFTALADVMRANAQSMAALLQERIKDTGQTAVSSFRWYEQLTEAHAAALQKFVPAFTALYAALSDSQRKTADTIFVRFAEWPLTHKARW
jgi:periplasmic protein CpxP/Spy